jgi:peptidyl-prolyl cis-trans isomerase SurA
MLKKFLWLLFLLPMAAISQNLQIIDKVVAVVNDNVITASELETQIKLARQQFIAKNMQLPPDNILRNQVLQQLIDVDLQLQLAKSNNITIDSVELDESILKIAAENHLTLTKLREELGRQGLSWENYRENIRKEMLIGRLQQRSVGKEVVVSSQQINDYLKTSHNNEKIQRLYHLQNLVIPLSEEPTSDELTKTHKKALDLLSKFKSGADFNNIAVTESNSDYHLESSDLGERHLAELPEVFANEVIDMKIGQIIGPIRTGKGLQLIKLVSIGDQKERHEVNKTHVRHILLRQDAKMTSIEAEKQINNLYQQLKSGADFAIMAKKYSLDAASAVKGGDLGWVVSEDLVPNFARTMNSLATNKISKPIKTVFGWHLIQVLERKTVDDSEMFQRQQVRQFLHQRKFAEAVQNWQQHIRSDAYINVMDKDLA